MTRRLAVLLLGALLVMLGATPATALPIIGDCKTSPTPEIPGRGITGFFVSPPKTPPPPGDPFTPGSTTSIYEQYGYAGLQWNTYDLGCGPAVARDPSAVVWNSVANMILLVPKASVAATGALLGAAFAPDFLGVFDPLITRVVDALQRTVFEQWAYLVLAALGIIVLVRARQASLSSTASAIGWALLVMVLVTVVGRWPLLAGHAADRTVTTVLGSVSAGLDERSASSGNAGAAAAGQMHDEILYQAWLSGAFGDSTSATARKYGPVIFDATALTWRQAAILHSDPGKGREIIDAKEAAFADAAAQIKTDDPDAYEYLTGRRSDNRVGFAVLAALATLCAVPFLFISGLLVLGALIIVRFGVMLFPAFATLGLFPTMRTLVTGIGSTVAAALINAMIFGIGAAVAGAGLAVLTDPGLGLPPWLAVVLMLLLTIVMWVGLAPFRRLTQMVGARGHFARTVGGPAAVGRHAARTAVKIAETAAGVAVGMRGAEPAREEPRPAQERAEAQPAARPTTVVAAVSDLPAQPQPAVEAVPAEAAPAAVLMLKPIALEPDAVHDPSRGPATRFEAAGTGTETP